MQQPPIAWACYGLLFALTMFAMLCAFKWLPSSYFKPWSTDGDVMFFDSFEINTPARFVYASILVGSNQVVNQLVGQTLGNYIMNEVADHKAPRSGMGGSDFRIHLTVQVFNVYSALAGAVRIFFMFSSFYFVVVQGLATAGVTYFVTRRRLRSKPDYATFVHKSPSTSKRYMLLPSA
jgi:hypothetical protein